MTEVIIHALIYAFERLRQDGVEEYDTYRWCKSVKKTLAKYEIKLNEETLEREASYTLAQKLLDSPVNRAFAALVAEDDGVDEED